MARKLQLRRGTAAQWTAANPVLAIGEPGFETDTFAFKLGNGSSAWNSLPYVGGSGNAINALSTLTPASGKVPYFTGASTAAMADSTSYGRSLLNAADEAALKALINAEAGVDFATPSALNTGLTRAAPVGRMTMWPGPVAPAGWVFCYGQDMDRTTYSALFNALCPDIGTATITIATPGVITVTGHGLTVGDKLRIFTTGALPTGLAVETDYFVSVVVDANQFSVSATFGGGSIATTGGQSGTHTVRRFPHGATSGTTFKAPDMRGYVPGGRDNMGGTSANRLTSPLNGDVLGRAGGAESVTMVRANLPNDTVTTTTNGSHTHTVLSATVTGQMDQTGSGAQEFTATNNATDAQGSHNHTFPLNGGVAQTAMANVQPTTIVNFIIFTDV